MLDVIVDTLLDGIKLIPFLFIAFLILELLEHKLSGKNKKIIEKSGKFGPIIGSMLGAFPQCGFSVAATNFYATRIITLGTLISIYLSTSDEMLPLLISEGVDIKLIIKVLGIKILIGMISGFIIDLIFRKKEKNHIHDFCEEEHCNCKNGVLISTIKHTLNITLFIIIISFILNTIIYYVGEDTLGNLIFRKKVLGPILSSLIGLIPNCASSVVITQLYLENVISFGAMMSGLLTGSGVAILVLFKVNKNLKENLKILSLVYIIGVISGIIIELINIV
jgi:putative flippase GtrA